MSLPASRPLNKHRGIQAARTAERSVSEVVLPGNARLDALILALGGAKSRMENELWKPVM